MISLDIRPLDEEIAEENKVVADWLLFYYERKAEYEREREDVLHSSPQLILQDVSPKNKPVTDVTARKAVQLVDKYKKLGDWLSVVEEVEQRLPLKMQVFYRLRREFRYARGSRGWVSAIQVRYPEAMAKLTGKREEDYWIGREKTFWEWWVKIVNYTARVAAKRGLI